MIKGLICLPRDSISNTERLKKVLYPILMVNQNALEAICKGL